MTNIILMTSLLPTTGHADIINFSLELGPTLVIVSGRSHEPVPLNLRIRALQEACPEAMIVAHENDDAPQNPEDVDVQEDFWNFWKDVVLSFNSKPSAVVASENYGVRMAEALDVPFVSYDIARALNQAKSTNFRHDPLPNWQNVLPLIKDFFTIRVTMFGQESVGKTTTSKLVAERLGGLWLPEYAREYLETVGSEITPERMATITKGQAAYQKLAPRKAERPFVVQDTDLYSTIGYYQLSALTNPIFENVSMSQYGQDIASETASDMYFVLPDNIPFEQDILRYGGDKRETSTEFWIKLLKDHSLPYVEVLQGEGCGTDLYDKVNFIVDKTLSLFWERWDRVKAFERE